MASPSDRTVAAMLLAVILAACGGGASRAQLASPALSPSPEWGTSYQTASFTVAGTSISFTAHLSEGWIRYPYGAELGHRPSFFVSVVDNTFSDPCAHIQRSPKVGSTVQAVATALTEIPGTSANEPIQTTLAGHAATYLELTFPASPCAFFEFYLWQSAPVDAGVWVTGYDSRFLMWIVEVGGRAVAIAGRVNPDTSDAAKAELHKVLDSIVFDVSPS